MYLDMQVAGRDPHADMQRNPHLTSIDVRDAQGHKRQNTEWSTRPTTTKRRSIWSRGRRAPIQDGEDAEIGEVFAAKADLLQTEHGQVIDMDSPRTPDFEVDRHTLAKQNVAAKVAREAPVEETSMIFDDEPAQAGQPLTQENLLRALHCRQGTSRRGIERLSMRRLCTVRG
ncbi:hypothetical protein [Streptomyces sp. NPDC001404]|uniref:hypothetical protein n=1 Tax=Streptomyces sp. NPDC001404 TaxID=3364571 RepID=UPI00369CAC94